MRKQIKKVLAVVMSMAMTVVMLPTVSKTNVEAVATRYEAENADYGTNTLQNDTWYASASNGAVVGMNGSWASDPYKTVTWTVNAETAGDYILTVGYCTTLQVELLAQVNGGDWYKFSEADPITFVLPASEDWNKAATATLKVTLNEGENTITVTGPIVDWNANWTAVYNQTGWPTANLDYIEIEKFSGEEVIPDAIGTHEVENAKQVNFTKAPESGSYYASCSGSAIVGVSTEWINNPKKHISQKVNAAKAGKYQLALQYCAPGPAEFLIQVNNGEWTYFDDEADVTGHVAPATGGWNAVGTINTVIELVEGENTINISGPVVDNSSGEGNFFTVFEENYSNAQSANLDCFIISEYVEPIKTYKVTVDGTVAAENLEEGASYTLPTTAEYGYYSDGVMYRPGATVTVNSDIAFTSVNTLSVTAEQGAGIRLLNDDKGAGIRFQATVTSDNMEAVKSTVITEGMLITANDLYETLGNSELFINSQYTFKNIPNDGTWYNGQTGTYCASIVKIAESNYIRNFIAKAYVIITYSDGGKKAVYSEMTGARSIKYVATAIKNAGYPNIADADKVLVDKFAAAK